MGYTVKSRYALAHCEVAGSSQCEDSGSGAGDEQTGTKSIDTPMRDSAEGTN